MTDVFSPQKRSAIMSHIHGKDTKPEWIVRRYLFSRGYRYRKHVKGLPGTPDIVLRKYRVVIFVHGCFWHGHEKDSHLPSTNTEFWRKKIERNQQRDNRNKVLLQRLGWNVLTIWECQLKPSVRNRTLMEMEYCINHAYLAAYRMEEEAMQLVADDATPYGGK